MFFDDPTAAFSNVRRLLAPEGQLAFVSWQSLPDNEWLTVVAKEVAKYTDVPEFGGLARGPGMFALKDQEETKALLGAADRRGGLRGSRIGHTHWRGRRVDESMDFLLGMGMVRGLVKFAGRARTTR